MKKIIASASLAVLGAASLQAEYAPGLSATEKSKPWTISAILRGFYDDNPTDSFRTRKQESWGLEVSPSLGVNIALDQTLIGFTYVYDLRFFEARPDNDADHSHLVNLKINHAFNERYKLDLGDTFNYAQEPELQSGIVSVPLRTKQNYIHNNGRAAFDPEMMVALLLYGYCQGERSSRVIEKRCVRDVGYRVVTGGLRPDHATIARFRARHEKALGGLFSPVLRLLAVAPPEVSLAHMTLHFPPVAQFLERFRALLRSRSVFDFDQERGRAALIACLRVDDVHRAERHVRRVDAFRVLVEQEAKVGGWDASRLGRRYRQEHRTLSSWRCWWSWSGSESES